MTTFKEMSDISNETLFFGNKQSKSSEIKTIKPEALEPGTI